MHRFGDGEGVGGEDLEFGGHAEENFHAFEALFVENVVDVGGQVCADSVIRGWGGVRTTRLPGRRCFAGRDRGIG